jgi:hypothetical protein
MPQKLSFLGTFGVGGPSKEQAMRGGANSKYFHIFPVAIL